MADYEGDPWAYRRSEEVWDAFCTARDEFHKRTATMSEINDPDAVARRIARQELEIADFDARITDLQEGRATAVKQVERDKADLAEYQKANGIATE
jgi:hypothetical protein